MLTTWATNFLMASSNPCTVMIRSPHFDSSSQNCLNLQVSSKSARTITLATWDSSNYNKTKLLQQELKGDLSLVNEIPCLESIDTCTAQNLCAVGWWVLSTEWGSLCYSDTSWVQIDKAWEHSNSPPDRTYSLRLAIRHIFPAFEGCLDCTCKESRSRWVSTFRFCKNLKSKYSVLTFQYLEASRQFPFSFSPPF